MEFLIQAKGHWMDDLPNEVILGMGPLEFDAYLSRSQKGDIVVARPDGWQWGNAECPPDYIVVKVQGLTDSYQNGWSRSVTVDIVSSNLPTDTFTLKISANAGVNARTGEGKITQAQANKYLTAWNCSDIVLEDNAVTFTVNILSAIKSTSFWHLSSDVGLTFTETNYNQTTGIHRIRINYSAASYTTEQRDQFLSQVQRVATFVGQNAGAKTITLDVSRDAVRNEFTRQTIIGLRKMIRKYRYCITPAQVDAVLAAGGTITIDRAALLAQLVDKTA